eukprot:1138208-Pelagomonas_calceolata.AAC.8
MGVLAALVVVPSYFQVYPSNYTPLGLWALPARIYSPDTSKIWCAQSSSPNNKLFSFVSELMDIMLAGEDQSQADQPNSLAEGPPMQI